MARITLQLTKAKTECGLIDGIPRGMDQDIAALHSRRGRPSIAPERLLRTRLLQMLFSIRAERQLVQQFEYNLLYRWFVAMNMDELAWNHSSFSTIANGCSAKR